MYSWVNQRLDRRWPNRGLNPVYVKRSQITFQKLLLALCWPTSIKSLIIPKSAHVETQNQRFTPVLIVLLKSFALWVIMPLFHHVLFFA